MVVIATMRVKSFGIQGLCCRAILCLALTAVRSKKLITATIARTMVRLEPAPGMATGTCLHASISWVSFSISFGGFQG